MEEHTLFHLITGASLAMIFVMAGMKTFSAMMMVIFIGTSKELYDHFFITNHIYYCDFDHHLNDWLSNLAFFPVLIVYKLITKKEVSVEIAVTWMLTYFALWPRDTGFADKTIWYEKEFFQSKLNIQNPYRGFVPWACSSGKESVPFSTIYSTVTWRELEPVQGQYNWKAIEKCWEPHLKKGRQAVVRLQIISPGSTDARAYPDWLINKYKISESPYSIDGEKGLVLDWNNENFLKEHEKLIKQLAKRYDKNNNIAWFEIGSYGFWGEWHMHENTKLAASLDTRLKIYEAYTKNFINTPLVIPYDDPQILARA